MQHKYAVSLALIRRKGMYRIPRKDSIATGKRYPRYSTNTAVIEKCFWQICEAGVFVMTPASITIENNVATQPTAEGHPDQVRSLRRPAALELVAEPWAAAAVQRPGLPGAAAAAAGALAR